MELQDYLVDCTVLVETDVGVGAGFFIAPGLVITPAHVVESPDGGDYPLLGEVTIRNRQETYRARTIRYAAGPSPDLAILRVEASDHPSAFLYGPARRDDPLFACGFDGDTREPERLVFEGSQMRGSLFQLEPGNAGKILTGAPVLNLRTGGVCAIVTAQGAIDSPQMSATAVSVVDSLFPEIRDVHDKHHEANPGWFDCSGVVGTAFAARTHLMAMRLACQEPIQPLLSPRDGIGAVDLMAPVQFKVLTDDGVDRMPLNLEDLAARCGSDGRGIMVVGPSGSGRSSMLRYLGYSAARSSGNLGVRGDHCLFPILIRANQIASRTGELEEQILNAIQKTSGPVGRTRLPSTFLSDLVETSGLRLLIMIDGVDEIQNSRDMVEVVDFIGRIQKETSFGKKARLVVTSKPSTAEHFRYSDVDVYQIQPLDSNSIEVAARRWFPDRADQFIKDNQPLVQTGLLSSPLALSLALALYERTAEPLSPRLVDLYGDLVRDTARNWSSPALRDKYGDEIIDNAVDVLGFLALELLRSATVQDRPWILHSVTSYFIQHLKADPARAGEIAARFVEFAAEDSLFLRTAGDRLYWSHLSFQDYFAAHRLVTASDEAGNAVKAIRSRWFDANRGNAPAFATAMLGSEDERMQIVWEIMSSGREERLDFVTSLIIDGAELPDDLLDQLVEDLVAKSDQEKEDYGTMLRPSARQSFAFDLLFSLGHIPQAGAALEAIASGSEWPSHMRGKAALAGRSDVS